MFLHVYLTANHFPYEFPFRPELTPSGWRDPGNAMPEVNEYLRRQAMTERDYKDFVARLKREFPGEPFLIVRFGDHQPDFAKLIIDPEIDVEELRRRLMANDPRYFTAYYAIDAINFRPVESHVLARCARCAVSAAGRAGGCWASARRDLRRAEKDSCSAAMACSMAAAMAPKRAASTGC